MAEGLPKYEHQVVENIKCYHCNACPSYFVSHHQIRDPVSVSEEYVSCKNNSNLVKTLLDIVHGELKWFDRGSVAQECIRCSKCDIYLNPC